MQNEASQDDTQLQEVGDENPESVFADPQIDGGYTKRVMEDLDALLADLQNTTAHISSYQISNQSQAGHPAPATPPQIRQQQQPQNFQPQRQFSHPQQQQQSYEVQFNRNNNGYSSDNSQARFPRYVSNGIDEGNPYHHQHSTQHQQQQYLDDPIPYAYGYQPQHSTEYPHSAGAGSRPTFDPQAGVVQGEGHVYSQVGFTGQGRDPQRVVTVKRVSYASSDDGGGHSGSSTPPPLPPPPPSEVLDSLAFAGCIGPSAEPDRPVYEQQSYPATAAAAGGGGGGGSGGGASNGGGGNSGVQQRQGSAKGRGERMSALSNNLSELDQLLQDLNSAQFMAEVDRKSSNIIKVLNYLEDQNEAGTGNVNEATTVVNGGLSGRSQTAPAVAPKPAGVRGVQHTVGPPQRTSVDNLLDELEGAAPPPGRFPVEPVDPHYQELSSVSTHPHLQQQHQHRVPQLQQHSQPYHLQPGGSHYLPASSSSTSSSSSYHHPQTASTATRELDELMNSLSEFKLQNTDEIDPEPAYAKPMKSRTASSASPTTPLGPGNFASQHQQHQQQQMQQQQPQQVRENGQLESMLGDLQSDMNRQGVNTKQKGVCAACQKPIVGQVIAALGKTWHVEHFVCAHCEEPLGTRNFYERDSLAYCETDYHHLFAPRCAYCNGPIVDKCIEALSKMWHPEHFFCAQCGRPFGEEDFHEKDGQAFCREDYFQMFAPKCGGCALPIMENYISALNRQWHPECFVCWDCRAQFGAGSFFDYEGLPYCETHYHAKKGSLCASCEKPITGRCITAMFKKFHPEHFVCAFCLKQLNKGTFKEQNDKPYCHPCFVKLFG